MLWIGIIALIFLALIGMPLYGVIAGGALLGYHNVEVDLAAITIEIYRMVDMPLLVALPLFTFTGYLLSESKASHRLVALSHAILGNWRGGLALVALITCAFFTAFTGASGMTIVALGGLLLPALQQEQYPEKFNLGLITSSGSLGLLLPPSLPLILYGIISQQMDIGQTFSLTQLFMAGILPACVMLFVLGLWSAYSLRNVPVSTQSLSLQNLKEALWDARWELPMPFVVVFSIYGGWLAISEVAVLTVIYVLIVEVFIYKEVPVKNLMKLIRDAMMMVGGILLILAVSLAFTNTLIDAEVPAMLFEWIQQYIDNKWVFLLVLNICLLLLGAVLDIFAAIVIVVPLILPVAVEYGIHPIHLGIIFLANMQIGYFTPPVGMNLFIASYRFNKPVVLLFQSTLPFLFVLLFALMLITYIPWLSLWML